MKTQWNEAGIGLLGAIVFFVVWIAVELALHALHVPRRAADVVIAIAGFALYTSYVRWTEHRSITELEPRSAWRELAAGFAIGLALFGMVIGILAFFGHYHVSGFGTPNALASGLLIWGSAAVMEELLFRGFIFRVARNVAGTWVAVGVSAVLFGSIHVFNPGATLYTSFAVALEAGVLLALAYAATNRLWLPIGLHAGWNYAEGTIFGTAVSGAALKTTLLHGTLTGSPLFTGGAFGVEASVVAIPVTLAAAAIFALNVKQQRWVEALA